MNAHEEMKTTLPRKAKLANDELLLLLEYGLPPPLRKKWHRSPDHVGALLEHGGFNLPQRFVLNTLLSNKNNYRGCRIDWYKKKWWYCFDNENRYDNAPLDQNIGLDKGIKACLRHVQVEHFCTFELEYLNKYLKVEEPNNNTENNNANENCASEINNAHSNSSRGSETGRGP